MRVTYRLEKGDFCIDIARVGRTDILSSLALALAYDDASYRRAEQSAKKHGTFEYELTICHGRAGQTIVFRHKELLELAKRLQEWV